MVTQIDKNHTAVIAFTMHPAREFYFFSDIRMAQRATIMGSIKMHQINSLKT